MPRRVIYLAVALVAFLLCVLIATRWVNLRVVRGFVGDWLVVILVYALVQAVCEGRPQVVALGVFLFACLVEGAQALGMADRLGLTGWMRIVLGTHFDPMDLLAYALGALTAWGMDRFLILRGVLH